VPTAAQPEGSCTFPGLFSKPISSSPSDHLSFIHVRSPTIHHFRSINRSDSRSSSLCAHYISCILSCLCLQSFHSSLTNFASMAPSSSAAGDEMHSQRTRSKSDADIDYSPQGMSAFISSMLVMFHAVIRRTPDLSSQSTTSLAFGLDHSAPFPLSTLLSDDDASFSWKSRCLSSKTSLASITLHLYLPCFFLLLLLHQTSTLQSHSTGLSTILILVSLYCRVLHRIPLVGFPNRPLGRRLFVHRAACHHS
jgi:hypothetical protein